MFSTSSGMKIVDNPDMTLQECKRKLYNTLLSLDFIGKNMVGVVNIEITLVPNGIHDVTATSKIKYK